MNYSQRLITSPSINKDASFLMVVVVTGGGGVGGGVGGEEGDGVVVAKVSDGRTDPLIEMRGRI